MDQLGQSHLLYDSYAVYDKKCLFKTASILNSTSGSYDEEATVCNKYATNTKSSITSSEDEIESGCVRPRKAPAKPKRAKKTHRNLNFEPDPMDFPLDQSNLKRKGFLRKVCEF